MQPILKANNMEKVRFDINGPVYEEALRLEKEGVKVLKLHAGNPALFGFEFPESLREPLINGIGKSAAYSDSKGMLEARQAIVHYHNGQKGFPNVTVDDVYTGNGVSELAEMLATALFNSGDEFLVPAPNYPLWSICAHMAGANPVNYMCDEQAGWMPDVDDIRKKITNKTKAILLINPNNPTGVVYSKEVLLDVLQVARENNLVVIADEIYDRIVMDGVEHHSCAALAPDLFIITMNGLSKSHIVCGFRCGWMVFSGPKAHAQSFIQAIQQICAMRLCSNTLAQVVIPAALADSKYTQDMTKVGGHVYERRQATMDELTKLEPLGVTFVRPSASFYIFPKIDAKRYNITDDSKFCLDFVREKHIMLVNGTGFDWPNPDHVRIVMLPKPEEMAKAIRDLGDFLQNYRQA